jgi:hypothetical protein
MALTEARHAMTIRLRPSRFEALATPAKLCSGFWASSAAAIAVAITAGIF